MAGVRRRRHSVASRSPGLGGARVYPTEEINIAAGYDVRVWLRDGLVDYVAPLVYAHNLLDADMPIEWLVEAAHAAGADGAFDRIAGDGLGHGPRGACGGRRAWARGSCTHSPWCSRQSVQRCAPTAVDTGALIKPGPSRGRDDLCAVRSSSACGRGARPAPWRRPAKRAATRLAKRTARWRHGAEIELIEYTLPDLKCLQVGEVGSERVEAVVALLFFRPVAFQAVLSQKRLVRIQW